jgi:hypothetical protein
MPIHARIQRARSNKLFQPIPTRLLPEAVAKTEEFAQTEMRSRASFIRIFYVGLKPTKPKWLNRNKRYLRPMAAICWPGAGDLYSEER